MNNENQTKVCKHCQSEIPKKAKVCPQCRKKQGGGMKWILIVLIAFGLIGALADGDEENVPDNTEINAEESVQEEIKEDVVEDTEPVIEYAVCTVSEMVELLESNAMKAEATYQDQYVEITGRLAVIDSDGTYITLYPSDDEWAFTGVTCYFKNEEQKAQVMEMEIDDTVTLKGQITDIGEILGYNLDIDTIN